MSVTKSSEDYRFLERIDLDNDGRLAMLLNALGAASLTVCPECRVDDFTHVEGCKTTGDV